MYDPWRKRPIFYEAQTKTFPLATGGELTLTLRKMGQIEKTTAFELAEKLKAQFIDGENEMLPDDFPPIGGEAIKPTETMLSFAAQMEVMQPPELPFEQRLSALDFVALQVVEHEKDVEAISAWVNEVNKPQKKADELEAEVPKPSGAATSD